MPTPPDFSVGQVLTAAHMDAVGLWLVKTQTIGTAVTSVPVTDAFSADFVNYKITISGGAGSNSAGCTLQLGSTNSGYYTAGTGRDYVGGAISSNSSNGANFLSAGLVTTDSIIADIELFAPQLAKRTFYKSTYIFGNPAGGGDMLYAAGYQNSTTQFTGFTYATTGGVTMTGGTIRVYGYRN